MAAMNNSNTIYVTARCAQTQHTKITYLKPTPSWWTYALEAIGVLVFGTALATVYLAVVVLRVVVL
jgi:hypothetical protein